MNEQNYINYYIEILTSTMTDAIIRNVSLQAQTKSLTEAIDNQSSQIESLNTTVENLKNEMKIYFKRIDRAQELRNDKIIDKKKYHKILNLNYKKIQNKILRNNADAGTFRANSGIKSRNKQQRTSANLAAA